MMIGYFYLDSMFLSILRLAQKLAGRTNELRWDAYFEHFFCYFVLFEVAVRYRHYIDTQQKLKKIRQKHEMNSFTSRTTIRPYGVCVCSVCAPFVAKLMCHHGGENFRNIIWIVVSLRNKYERIMEKFAEILFCLVAQCGMWVSTYRLWCCVPGSG